MAIGLELGREEERDARELVEGEERDEKSAAAPRMMWIEKASNLRNRSSISTKIPFL
jgi:hypothetical protein